MNALLVLTKQKSTEISLWLAYSKVVKLGGGLNIHGQKTTCSQFGQRPYWKGWVCMNVAVESSNSVLSQHKSLKFHIGVLLVSNQQIDQIRVLNSSWRRNHTYSTSSRYHSLIHFTFFCCQESQHLRWFVLIVRGLGLIYGHLKGYSLQPI